MKTILLLDTETTGLDAKKDQVIEVAVTLFDLDHATAIETYASLIRASGNDAEHVNRIPAAALPEGPDPLPVWQRVLEMASRADVLGAHRAEFDKGFVDAALAQHGLVLDKHWVCTKFHIPWPRQNKPGASLVQLALDLDLGVAYAHRAAADVDLMVRCFARAKELGHDLHELMRMAMRPRGKIIAEVSFAQKDIAKQHGFQWDGEAKQWWLPMAIEDAEKLPFKWRVATQAA